MLESIDLDADEMLFVAVLNQVESRFAEGIQRVNVKVDDHHVITFDRYSDCVSNAFWRPGRNFVPLLIRLLSEYPEEIEKLRNGKKMRNVKAFFLGKLQEQLPYVDSSYALMSIHHALTEAQ